MAKNKTAVRSPWTKDDLRELKVHSKAKTPVVKVAKGLKRTEGAVRQKAKTIGIGLGTVVSPRLRMLAAPVGGHRVRHYGLFARASPHGLATLAPQAPTGSDWHETIIGQAPTHRLGVRRQMTRLRFFERAIAGEDKMGVEPSLMDCGRQRRLRPAQKGGSAGLGQGVDSPLDGDEPPIDIAAQDFRSVWNVHLKVPGTLRALRQRGCASECALPIRRHDRLPRPSAFNRIAPSAAMLLDETGSAAGILARRRRGGTHEHLNVAIRPHSE
jgi:hypothetical protein